VVAIGVLTWRGEALTRVCLEELRQLRGGPYPTVVVDNASGTGEAERLATEVGAPVEALTRTINDGVAGGYNAAVTWAIARGATHVLLVNNDVEFLDPDIVTKLLAAATSRPDVAAVGPLVYDPDRSLFSAGGVFSPATGRSDHLKAPRFVDRPYEVAWLDGPALLVSVEAMRRIGGLSPAFFMYWEDVDWCFRARATGFHCLVEPSASILHMRGARTSGIHQRLQWRNRVLFIRRHGSRRDNATSLVWMLGLSTPKAVVRRVHSRRPIRPLLASIGGALAWNVRDAARRRSWRLEPDGPDVIPDRPGSGRSVAIVIDDLAAAVVASRNPDGIQRVVAGLVDSALTRSDLRAWPAITQAALTRGDGVALLEVDRLSLPWRRVEQPAAGRRLMLRAARRTARSLPLSAPRLHWAKVFYGRASLGAAGLTTVGAPADGPTSLVVAGGFWSGGMAGRVRRLAADGGVPVALLVHDLFPIAHPEWYPDDLRRDFVDAIEEILPVVRRVAVMSDAVARDVRDRLPGIADAVRVGTPTLAAHRRGVAVIARALGPSISGPFVLMVGTVEPRKNHRLALAAWRIARRHLPWTTRLVIAGRHGWLSEDVEREIAGETGSGGVIRLEEVSDDALDSLYAACRATVHPSLAEGLGLPARESVARGIPTLISSAIPLDGLPPGSYATFGPSDADELAGLIVEAVGREPIRTPVQLGEGTGWEPVVSALLD